MKLSYKQITDFEDFFSIKDQWNDLVKSTQIDHAFLRHEWFENWIKYLKPKGRLVIHTAWDIDKLVAIAPLQIVRETRKKIPLRLLSFMSSSVTPRNSFIIDASIDPRPFYEHIFSTPGWEIAELKSIEAESPTTKGLLNYLEDKKKFVIEDGLQSPYEIFESDWDTHLKNRSKNYKNDFRKCFNRLKKTDNYKIFCIDTFDVFEQYYDSLIKVSGHSWKAKEGTDLKSSTQLQDFYKNFTQVASKDGLFLVYVLIINSDIVAFNYYLRHNNDLVAIRSDYNEEFSYFMPGTILHLKCLQDNMDAGKRWEYDLTGNVSAYKLKFVKNIRKHLNITVAGTHLLSKLLVSIKDRIAKRNISKLAGK
ncbi:MAG: hypothetical protein DRP96_09570 [Candidatus Neomarinimicrobiota bacterium]|nr:MAG: hypothetical protein DRP96_09570 [Candidatus Neomarinimicrobiota bacterium]